MKAKQIFNIMSGIPLFCRFCAKEQSQQSVRDLKTDERYRRSILKMLSIFRNQFVDFSCKYLPETVCNECRNILSTCYEFYKQVRKSQAALNRLYNVEVNLSTDVKEESMQLAYDSDDRGLKLSKFSNKDSSNWSSYPWHCAHCTTALPSKEDLIEHNQEFHGTCSGFRCADCGERVEQFEGFVEHVQRERSIMEIYCEYCNLKMENTLHKEAHKSDHNCVLCGQIFTSKSLLDDHLNRNTSISVTSVYDNMHVQNIKIDTATVDNELTSYSNTVNNSSNIYIDDHSIYDSEYQHDVVNDDDKMYTLNDTQYDESKATDLMNNTLFKTNDTTCDNAFLQNYTQMLNNNKTSNKSKHITNKIKYRLNKEINKAVHKLKEEKFIKDIDTKKIFNKRKQNLNKTNDESKEKLNKFNDKMNTVTDVTIYRTAVNKVDTNIESWSDYPHICKYCNIKVAYKDVLSKHCIVTHKKCFGNKCIDCNLDLSNTFEQFVQHVLEHRPYLKNMCPYCDMRNVIDTDHLETHKTRHQCSKCSQVFPKMRDLRRHDIKVGNPINISRIRRRGPITDKDITCDVCGKRLKTPLSLRCHKITHTVRKRDHTCDRCGKAFYTKDTLEGHRKLHEKTKETCQICSKEFATIQRLRRHVKTHNLKLPFQCDDCKKFFNSKDSLRAHVSVHLDIKPYECMYCLKRFRHKHVMKTHENQHTGARPYSCDICCLNFACWSNCDKHMRRIHGTPLAKTVKTPHGKIAIDPETGKPSKVSMTSVVKEWGRNLLEKSARGGRRKSLKTAGEIDVK